jgi:2-desacetyl-2-hydroxyethyl bacteriochlorophyllide A dehydrogenase
MKAMLLEAYNQDLAYRSVCDPEPGDNDIVIAVKACGMCQTDIKLVSGQLSAAIALPHIPGHEIAGEVIHKGKKVEGLRIGDKGVVFHIIPCGRCEPCLTGRENLCFSIQRIGFEHFGGFAEFVSLPESNFCSFEADIPFEQMAILPDAVATPFHALEKLAYLGMGNTILIIGVGGLGIHAVQIAAKKGALVIAADLSDEALGLAKTFGAEWTTNPRSENSREKILEITKGRGVDIILDGVGRQESVDWSLGTLKKGGHYCMMGYDPIKPLCLPMLSVHNNEWTIHGIKATTKQELKNAVKVVERGQIKPYVSKCLPLSQANEGLEAIRKGTLLGRTVLIPGSQAPGR